MMLFKQLFFVFVLAIAVTAFGNHPTAPKPRDYVGDATAILKVLFSQCGGVPNTPVWLSTASDNYGVTHVKFNQYYRQTNWPIYGSQAIVHFKGNQTWVTQNIKNVTNTINPPNAFALTIIEILTVLGTSFSFGSLPADFSAQLVVLPRAGGEGFGDLVYLVSYTDGVDHVVYTVDLNKNKKSQCAPRRHGVSQMTTQIATTYYYNNQNVSSDFNGQKHIGYTDDYIKNITVRNCNGKSCTPNTLNNAYSYNSTGGSWQVAANRFGASALFAAQVSLDYFNKTFNFTGPWGTPTLPATDSAWTNTLYPILCNYTSHYNDAFWTSTGIYLGAGDGTTYNTFSSVDVLAHEITHGMIQLSSGLSYNNESGAVEEAFSDFFAAMAEYSKWGENPAIWVFGENVTINGQGIRHIDRPDLDGRPVLYSNRYTGTDDSGGIHTNSGIATRAFYLIAKGGTTTLNPSWPALNGIGINKTATIVYRAMMFYLTSSSDFMQLKTACTDAAFELYGGTSSEFLAVWNAFGYVDIGDIKTTNGTQLLVNGMVENGQAPWSIPLGGDCYVNLHTAGAHGGRGMIQAGFNSNVSTPGFENYCVVQQNFQLPNYTISYNLSFWVKVETSDTSSTNTDFDQGVIIVSPLANRYNNIVGQYGGFPASYANGYDKFTSWTYQSFDSPYLSGLQSAGGSVWLTMQYIDNGNGIPTIVSFDDFSATVKYLNQKK